jgi:hypothetical protein
MALRRRRRNRKVRKSGKVEEWESGRVGEWESGRMRDVHLLFTFCEEKKIQRDVLEAFENFFEERFRKRRTMLTDECNDTNRSFMCLSFITRLKRILYSKQHKKGSLKVESFEKRERE